jgi:hypothetical protein
MGKRAGLASRAVFEPLTFRRGFIGNAAFAPDGRTVVYSARWEGNPPEVFSTQAGSPEARSLGLADAQLADVSGTGELAVLIGKGAAPSGMLARVPLGGGAPREVLEGVVEAAYGPDGTSLAVVRLLATGMQIEYPIGQLRYRSGAGISWARVSRGGDRIAFFEHPVAGDARGDVVMIDLAGKKTVLSRGWEDLVGLAWPPRGKEVWFTAAHAGTDRPLYAVSLEGVTREVERVPGSLILHAISAAGDVLVSQGTQRTVTLGSARGGKEVDLSWLDYPFVGDISPDGGTILMTEQGVGGGPEYSAYLRRMDASPAVRLGKGLAQALSPDGKTALVAELGAAPRLVLQPTGAGQARSLPSGPLQGVHFASFFPDGGAILITGYEPGHGPRLYRQDLAGGLPAAFTGEGVATFSNTISPDGAFVAAQSGTGPGLYPVGGGSPRPIPGIAPGDAPLVWGTDPAVLYVRGRAPAATRGAVALVYRIDMANRRRELWKELTPADLAGVSVIGGVRLTPDGRSYAYTYSRNLTNLYLIKGLK